MLNSEVDEEFVLQIFVEAISRQAQQQGLIAPGQNLEKMVEDCFEEIG